MGHVAFADPGIRRFHLHERLGRELRSRGHRTSVLCTDPAAFTFWSAQDQGAVALRPADRAAAVTSMRGSPLAELAELHCQSRGERSRRALRRAADRLARLLPSVERWLAAESPDLVVLHRRRDGVARLVQFAARAHGADVLWTGDGLLPNTLQLDSAGLDGESSAARSCAADFRDVARDERFCASALAGTLGRTLPLPLARRELRVPPFAARLADAFRALRPGPHAGFANGLAGACRALRGWRAAAAAREPDLGRYEIPAAPFVAVLLQRDDDPRLRLDAPGAPSPSALVRAALAAANATGLDLEVTAVLPEGGLRRRDLAGLAALRVPIEIPAAACEAAAAAAAVVTVNHPFATAGLLAGTPVLHFGRVAYGVPGVATRTDEQALAPALRAALAADQPALRMRFLTWLFRQGHVWCSPEHPDHNGIAGLVERIEALLGEPTSRGRARRYHAGPAWPLRAEGPG